MATTAPSILPTPAKSRRRWWLCGVLALALLVLVAAAFYFYLEDAARRDWDAAVAETDALDPRWRLEDLQADRPERSPITRMPPC